MSGFRFRLQQLLNMRERQEQLTARSVAEARSAMNSAEQRLRSLEAARHTAVQPRAGAPTGRAGEAQQLALIMEQLDGHIAEAGAASRDAQDEMEKRLVDLAAAAQHRLVLDKLRANRFASWTTEQGHAEQRISDEVALMRFRAAANGGV